MISYSEFKLTDAQLEHAKQEKAAKAISKYIKENGVEPTSTDEYYTLTDEELEQYKRVYYAIYLSGNGSSSTTGSTDSGSSSSSSGITYMDISTFESVIYFQMALFSVACNYAYMVETDLDTLDKLIPHYDGPYEGTFLCAAMSEEAGGYGLKLPERYCYKISTAMPEDKTFALIDTIVDEHLVITMPTNYDAFTKIHIFSFNLCKAYGLLNGIKNPHANRADRLAIYMKDNQIVSMIGFSSNSYEEGKYYNVLSSGTTALTINFNFNEGNDYNCTSKLGTLEITLKHPDSLSANEATLSFQTGDSPNITFTTENSSDNIVWANGTPPTFEANTIYMIKMKLLQVSSTYYFICEYCTFS